MIPWTLLDTALMPADAKGKSAEIRLLQRDTEFSIQIGHDELMNSRSHGSEEALAELACAKIQGFPRPRILIGGLGMGFTVAAALKGLYPEAKVEVAELLQAVVTWNQGPLAPLASHPLKDPRVSVKTIDVTKLIKADQQAYEAILLDIDNGPTPMTKKTNAWLYSLNGLKVVFAALVPGGVLAIWSAGPDQDFVLTLEKAGFTVEEQRVKSHGRKGSSHIIWLATRPVKPLSSGHFQRSGPPRAYRPRAPKSN